MTHGRPTPERLGALSDGVFAVIITIMVLELKPPSQPSFATLLPLWPTGLSYAVSYLFITIVWVNPSSSAAICGACSYRASSRLNVHLLCSTAFRARRHDCLAVDARPWCPHRLDLL